MTTIKPAIQLAIVALCLGVAAHSVSAMTMAEFIADAGERCENSGFPAGTPQHSECVRILAQADPAAATQTGTKSATETGTEPSAEAVSGKPQSRRETERRILKTGETRNGD